LTNSPFEFTSNSNSDWNELVVKQVEQEQISLKIAAIIQLGDFIQGVYGENLRRPAFYTLRSLWDGYVRPSYEMLSEWTNKTKFPELTEDNIKSYSKCYYRLLQKDQIIKVLNLALIKGLTDKSNQNIASFSGFESDLKGLFLVGLNTHLMPNTTLIFKNLVLNSDVKLDYSHLRNINFIGTELNGLDIKYSTFYNVKFIEKSTMNLLHFYYCTFFDTHFSNVALHIIFYLDLENRLDNLDLEEKSLLSDFSKFNPINFIDTCFGNAMKPDFANDYFVFDNSYLVNGDFDEFIDIWRRGRNKLISIKTTLQTFEKEGRIKKIE